MLTSLLEGSVIPESNFTSAQGTILYNEFENYTFNITTESNRGQWVKRAWLPKSTTRAWGQISERYVQVIMKKLSEGDWLRDEIHLTFASMVHSTHPDKLIRTEGRFKNAYELLNLRPLKISMLHKNHIFQCMGYIVCVEFQRVPLKFHTKYVTHTLKDIYIIHRWRFKSS